MLLVMGVSLSCCAVSAQSTRTIGRQALKTLEKAEALTQQDKLDEAIQAYHKVLELEPSFTLANTRLGALHFDLGRYDKSKYYFNKVIETSPEEFPLIYYKLGEMAWRSESYDSVTIFMDQFLTFDYGSNSLRARAEKYRRDAGFVSQSGPVQTIQVDPLPPGINTSTPEYLPSMPATDAFMVFTRRVHGQEDFFISVRDNDQWLPGQPIHDLNTPENEGAHCVSADGKMLIFTACAQRDGLGSCDLYYSIKQRSKWTKPKNMGPNINTGHWEGQPSISSSGRTLYFSSSRAGGKGGRDLWKVERSAKGWSKPTNLAGINTPENDEAPFIHADGETMYFMSDGHPGYGGSDLFISRLKDGRWQEPHNLGAPLNTPADEGALHINIKGTTGYFARTVPGKQGSLDIDIFQFPVPKSIQPRAGTYANIQVTDARTGQPLQGIVDVYDLEQDLSLIKTYTDAEGQLLICLSSLKDYAVNVQKKGYSFFSTNINLKDTNSQLDPYRLEAKLHSVVVPTGETPDSLAPIILENVFFASGSASLLPRSTHELKKLYRMMDENPQMAIEIHGHTDNVGSEADNELLSVARAKTIYDFLIQHDIAASRLEYRGFGEMRPLVSNDTEVGRQTNRRTEFIITHR